MIILQKVKDSKKLKMQLIKNFAGAGIAKFVMQGKLGQQQIKKQKKSILIYLNAISH